MARKATEIKTAQITLRPNGIAEVELNYHDGFNAAFLVDPAPNGNPLETLHYAIKAIPKQLKYGKKPE